MDNNSSFASTYQDGITTANLSFSSQNESEEIIEREFCDFTMMLQVNGADELMCLSVDNIINDRALENNCLPLPSRIGRKDIHMNDENRTNASDNDSNDTSEQELNDSAHTRIDPSASKINDTNPAQPGESINNGEFYKKKFCI